MAFLKEVAAHLDLSERHVRRLVKDGILPPSKGHGGYDIEACRVAYIRYLRGLSSGQTEKSQSAETEEGQDFSRLVEMEKHRKLKRENDLEEQRVAPVHLITETIERVGRMMIPILESLPLIMKRNWPEITGDQIHLVKKSIAECRNMVADMKLDLDE